MQATDYNICDLSKCFDTIEEAVNEAKDFLAKNYRDSGKKLNGKTLSKR
jgi:hypothetical protein